MLIILFLSFSFVFGIKDMKGLTREWDQFKMDFNKTYESDIEEHLRFEIFANTYNKIRTHNAKYEAGRVSYKLGINQFSDLTTLELNRKMNAYQRSYKSRHGTLYKSTLSPNKSLPDSIDWRSKGAVTPVKDQNHCGCCWAFSATGAIEGHNFLKTGKLVSLSEQNLVDCAKNGGNDGCNGGYMNEAFTYVIQNKGIDSEESYPYEAKDNDCRFNEKTIGATLTDFVRLPSGNEEILKEVVATIGPVATAIDTSDEHYRSFKSGVFNIDKCSSERLTHGVLIVGYGTEEGNDYWLVKNSYGKSWGLDGYIKMARNKQNHCGIATDASYPVV